MHDGVFQRFLKSSRDFPNLRVGCEMTSWLSHSVAVQALDRKNGVNHCYTCPCYLERTIILPFCVPEEWPLRERAVFRKSDVFLKFCNSIFWAFRSFIILLPTLHIDEVEFYLPRKKVNNLFICESAECVIWPLSRTVLILLMRTITKYVCQ